MSMPKVTQSLKIKKLYAIICRKGEEEVILAIKNEHGYPIPLVALDMADLQRIKPIADAFCDTTNSKYEFRIFSHITGV